MTDLRAHDVLLIVGKSPERWDDVERFWNMGVEHDVCCINQTGIVYPCPFRHWFSYHGAELVEQWGPQNPGAMLHTTGPPMSGIKRWRLKNTRGSSSLQAVRCALRFWGYKRVVVAGVALSGDYYDTFYKHWLEALPEISEDVRSMSGHTMRLLGEPTKEWLALTQ